MPTPDSSALPPVLTKNQMRNLQRRRNSKLLKSAVQFATEHASVTTAENLKLVKQTRYLTSALDAAKKTADAFAKNADVAKTDKRIVQRTLDNVTKQLVDKNKTIQTLQFRARESARLERSISHDRAAAFVQDPSNQP